MARAVRVGFGTLVGALAVGAAMIVMGITQVFAGDPQAAYATGGSLKLAHFAAMHGIAILPGLAWLTSCTRWTDRRRERVVALGTAGYLTAVGAVVVALATGATPLALPAWTTAIAGTAALLAAGGTSPRRATSDGDQHAFEGAALQEAIRPARARSGDGLRGGSRRPGSSDQDDPEPIRVGDRHADLVPVRVGARHGRNINGDEYPVDLLPIAEIENQKILDVSSRNRHVLGHGELQVCARAGQVEHHAAVAVVTGEASDLRQSQPVSVEGDDLIQPRGLASHSHLHRANLTADGPSSAEGCDGNPRQPTSEPKRTYVDHGLTGTNRARPGLREALAACRAGDTLVVTKLDRLARSVHDPTDPVGRLLFNALAMIAEFEADLARLRTREGMKVARAKGRVRGKQPKLSPRQQAHLVALHQAREHTIGELEELFSVTRSTVYRAPRPRSSRALSPDARRTRALRWRWLHRMDLLPQQTGQQLTVVGDRIGQPDQVRQDGAE